MTLIGLYKTPELILRGPPPRALCIVAGAFCAQLGSASVAAAQSTTADAQSSHTEWNDPAVLELVRRAGELRGSVAVDPDFRTYQAEARGYVYFFLDRPGADAQTLVKTDQVALDVFWQAPNHTRQSIVGLRDEERLPTDIQYHLDHLTVVQDDFGEFIRMGDGDEVERVVHPVGPGADAVYDYQLSDSLTISYAGGAERIRVYEVRVRPKNFGAPGYVGTVFLDRDRAAIVRMNFSFSPASYVDPYLDYIRISLDNSLWLGEYWLPYRQEIEIRREIPVFDFLSGSVIRTRFDIRAYDFNVELSPLLFAGQRVMTVSPAQREAFPFERGLYDDLEEAGGLGPSPTMADVRAQVREVVEDEVLSGLKPVRLHVGSLSDFARYNRAEGVFVGAGLSLRPRAGITTRTTGGYSFGRSRPSGRFHVRDEDGRYSVEAYWDGLGDIGGNPGATPLENTMTSASGSKDYLDPYFRRGATLQIRPGGNLSRWTVSLTAEDQSSAVDVVSDGPDTEFRSVRSIEEGTLVSGQVALTTGPPAGGRSRTTVRAASLDGRTFGSVDLSGRWELGPENRVWSGLIRAATGIASAGAPPQALYLLGGRHTLPGHDYRAFVGRAYWLLRGEVTVPVYPPYVGLRGFAAGGATYLDGATTPSDWVANDSAGFRGAVGLGLSLGWDTMRIDLSRAVRGSGWEAVFSVAPGFSDWM